MNSRLEGALKKPPTQLNMLDKKTELQTNQVAKTVFKDNNKATIRAKY